MKTLANRVMTIAASAVMLGTVAYGQTQIKADIPFAFQAGRVNLPAGAYVVSPVQSYGGAALMQFRNAAGHQSVVSVGTPMDTQRTVTKPKMVFLCGSAGCSLSAIKTSSGTIEYSAPHRAARGKEVLAVLSIPAAEVRGE